jgi:hypothetical protein
VLAAGGISYTGPYWWIALVVGALFLAWLIVRKRRQ